MRVAYWKTEECSLNQLLLDLSRSTHSLLALLSQWWERQLGACASNSRSHCHCRGHCHRSCFKSSKKIWSRPRCCSQHRCRSQWRI